MRYFVEENAFLYYLDSILCHVNWNHPIRLFDSRFLSMLADEPRYNVWVEQLDFLTFSNHLCMSNITLVVLAEIQFLRKRIRSQDLIIVRLRYFWTLRALELPLHLHVFFYRAYIRWNFVESSIRHRDLYSAMFQWNKVFCTVSVLSLNVDRFWLEYYERFDNTMAHNRYRRSHRYSLWLIMICIRRCVIWTGFTFQTRKEISNFRLMFNWFTVAAVIKLWGCSFRRSGKLPRFLTHCW